MKKNTDIDYYGIRYTQEEWEKTLAEEKAEDEKRKKRNKEIPKLKHYLKGAWYWQHKRDYLSDKILRLRSQAEKITTTYTDTPSFGGGYTDHRQQKIAEMIDTQRKYENASQECKKKLTEIAFFINSLEGYPECYQDVLVLEMRYLYFESWQDIAIKLNYDERQIYRIHGRALLHLLEVHKKIIENSGKRLF